jgi:hypothetical protein
LVASSTGCFINWLLHQLVVSLIGCFINWLFHQLTISSKGHFINPHLHQLHHMTDSSTLLFPGTFINLSIHQPGTSSIVHPVNYLFCQHVISSITTNATTK